MFLTRSSLVRRARSSLNFASAGLTILSSSTEGTGKLTVDVKAPSGTIVNADGGGIFKKLEMGAPAESSRYGPQGP